MGQVYDVPVTDNSFESVRQNGLYVGTVNFTNISTVVSMYIGCSAAGIKCVAGRYLASDNAPSFGVTIGANFQGKVYCCYSLNSPTQFFSNDLIYNLIDSLPNRYVYGYGYTRINQIIDSGISLYDDSPNDVIDNGYNALYQSLIMAGTYYPIIYEKNHCVISGPSAGTPGESVVIQVTPDNGYKFVPSTVSVIGSDGIAIPYIVQDNLISFTFPNVGE